MKIIFEHQGRKTTVIGADYDTMVNNIRSLYPDQHHHRIQFYDPELTDYFEFTSYSQIIDQPNGLKMNFDTSDTIDLITGHPCSSPMFNKNEKNNNINTHVSSKRSRKKSIPERDDKVNELPTLPTYCDMIIQGLQSREFLHQTCTHFLQQYPDGTSTNIHHSFIMAIIQKFPALSYLDKSTDGVDGKAPYVIYNISSNFSKEAKCEVFKNSSNTKKPRQSILDSSYNGKTNKNAVVDATTEDEEDVPNLVIGCDKQDSLNECSIEEVFDGSNINKTSALLPDSNEQSPVAPPASKISIQPSTISTNRRATISLVPSSAATVTNDTNISIKPILMKSIITTNASTSLIYHNGHMHPTPDKLLSKSEQNAYNKDIARLRSIIKPNRNSTYHVSIGEIHALIGHSHTIRRRLLYQKQDMDFIVKVLEYQEIFHEEAVM
ncbi:unnamed protein product [Rotaria sp. Silwood2]|nr:unnamed protein product [Rotaria sp. Silwood2]